MNNVLVTDDGLEMAVPGLEDSWMEVAEMKVPGLEENIIFRMAVTATMGTPLVEPCKKTATGTWTKEISLRHLEGAKNA